jgi:hypothetical protein
MLCEASLMEHSRSCGTFQLVLVYGTGWLHGDIIFFYVNKVFRTSLTAWLSDLVDMFLSDDFVRQCVDVSAVEDKLMIRSE